MLEKFSPSDVAYYDAINSLSPEQLAREWREITLDQFYYLLECLPPKVWKDNAFMVGECMTHHQRGAIYEAVAQVDERYFARPALLQSFNPATYTQEIQKQFSI